jgi:hypothetical protein
MDDLQTQIATKNNEITSLKNKIIDLETQIQNLTPPISPNTIIIENFNANATVYRHIDQVELNYKIKIKNTDDHNQQIHYKIIFEGKKDIIEEDSYIPPGSWSISQIKTIKRNLNEYNYNMTIYFTKTGENITTIKYATSIPITTIGNTTIEVPSFNNLTLTLLSWKESEIAVDGPYASGYYTFTAKPGMKFVVLFFTFQNNWVRVQETPYIDSGEIFTDKGYIYNLWNPPVGVHSVDYNPRLSTEQEVKELIGSSGAYVNLLQGEVVKGCVVFEISKDSKPTDAFLHYFSNLIIFL